LADISKINAVALANIAKLDAVTAANLAKVNGLVFCFRSCLRWSARHLYGRGGGILYAAACVFGHQPHAHP
jgi:hypothetical protein